MKVSLNSIQGLNQRYGCADDVTAIGIDKLIEKIGSQLGGVDEVIRLGELYEGIVIAKVLTCNKHPNADKLSICIIDDGGVVSSVERDSEGHVQVVCGAPNAREGILVAWLPPGSIVPESRHQEPFVLEARDIRGQVSNGMLASPKELALGDNHEGILEIDGEPQTGSDFAEVYGLKDDVVLDIENKMFTHRPDCFGFLGIDRELAGIQQLPFKSPDWYVMEPNIPGLEAEELPLEVKNELPNLVPRFTAIVMSNVKVRPSPTWLQVELAKLGMKSINNIVDYSNFFMLETGQPIHIYDYDKVQSRSDNGVTLVVRNPKPGEKVKLLNGKEIEPRAEAMLVATDKELICVGGAMGGIETEVDSNTKNIIIEAANWDMYEMRRTAMEHGIFTDAVTRFTKGQSPLQNKAVIAKIVDEIRQHASGQVASSLVDDNHVDNKVLERGSLHLPVKLSADFINQRLGLELESAGIKSLLENVEFKVDVSGDELSVTAPFWRTDIEIREDVVEEVGRLYGYDHLPLVLARRDLTPAKKDDLLSLKGQIRSQLAKSGANEALTYSFVHGDLLSKVGQDKDKAFQVANALSPDLQYYRLSILPSLMDKVYPNIKAGYLEFALFELGKTHEKDALDEAGLPQELDNLALVYATQKADKGAPYYAARKFLTSLASSLGLEIEFAPLKEHVWPADAPFQLDRSAIIYPKGSKEGFGVVGEFTATARQSLKLPSNTAGFEIGLGPLRAGLKNLKPYMPLPRFPKVRQDITLKVSTEHSFQEVFDFLSEELNKTKDANTWTDLQPLDIFQKEDDPETKHLTFRLTIASYERTLTDVEVNKLLDTLAAVAKTELGGQRI